MCCAHPGSFHSRTLFIDYGNFNENYLIAGDYELLLRKKENLNTAFLNYITVHMLADGVSSSSLRVFYETFKAKLTNTNRNIFILYIEMFFHLNKHFIRKLFKI